MLDTSGLSAPADSSDVSKETGLAKGKGRRGLSQQFKDFREYFSDLQHAKTLFAVSAVWFL